MLREADEVEEQEELSDLQEEHAADVFGEGPTECEPPAVEATNESALHAVKLPTMLPLRPGGSVQELPVAADTAPEGGSNQEAEGPAWFTGQESEANVEEQHEEQQLAADREGQGIEPQWFGATKRKTNADAMKDGSWFKSFKQSNRVLFT